MTSSTPLILIIAFVVADHAAFADDIIRCKGALIRSGMIAPEVLSKCGEPASKMIESIPVRVRRANGTSGIAGVTQIEHWTYDRGAGQFPALLTFEQGKLKSVELVTGR